MDMENEVARFKWLLIVGIAFFVSGIYSFNELRYFLFSSSAEATITNAKTQQIMQRRRHSTYVLVVNYTFTDGNNKVRHESDGVPTTWHISPGETATVHYFGADDTSRLKGNYRWFAIIIFLVCSALFGFTIFKFYREANEALYGKRKPRTKF